MHSNWINHYEEQEFLCCLDYLYYPELVYGFKAMFSEFSLVSSLSDYASFLPRSLSLPLEGMPIFLLCKIG